MPNIGILLREFPSDLLQAIMQSNARKKSNLEQDVSAELDGSSPRSAVS